MQISSVMSRIGSRPELLYYYAQKAVRWMPLRNLLGAAVAMLVGRPAGASRPEASAAVRQLRDEGICFLPQLAIGDDDLARIRDHLRGRPATDQYDGVTQVNVDTLLPGQCDRAFYPVSDVLACEPLMRLANSPVVLDAVAGVLGARPTIAAAQIWWTLGELHVPGRVHYDDVYHRDVDDLRFVKLFAYLTDTSEKSGAHSFVKRSHQSRLLTRRGPITDEEVAGNFPAADIVTITGKAGTVFLEDTWGIHRPLPATEGRRLIFSVLYALTPWVPMNSGKASGLALPAGFDPHVNRAMFQIAGKTGNG